MGRTFSLAASPGFLLLLIAFFMPWYAVTCSNREMATASGWQVATSGFQSTGSNERPGGRARRADPEDGGPQRTPPASPASSSSSNDSKMRAVWVILVPILALAGAAFALLGARVGPERAKRFRLTAAGVGGLTTALLIAHYFVARGQLHTEVLGRNRGAPDSAREQQMLQAIANAVTLEIRWGWYLALVGVVLATIFAVLSVITGEKPAAPASAPS